MESCALIGQLLQTLLRDPGSPRETGRGVGEDEGKLASPEYDRCRPRRVAMQCRHCRQGARLQSRVCSAAGARCAPPSAMFGRAKGAGFSLGSAGMIYRDSGGNSGEIFSSLIGW